MFISRAKLEALEYKVEASESNYKVTSERYWSLVHELDIIKAHLKIRVIEISKHLKVVEATAKSNTYE